MQFPQVRAALARYEATEPSILAWAHVDPQLPSGSGPLDGVPFGVKDIFETVALPTEYGSPLYAGRRGEREASIVTTLRQLGGVLFGKTHTAAFAYFDPPPTRNPRDLAHTPGGSSSGSAAAVAAGVVPFALGTQTMGSVIRPASFCGVTGFKPGFGVLPRDGVLPFAPSLDTVGLIAESASVVSSVWSALGFPVNPGGSVRFAAPGPLPPVSPEMAAVFDECAGRLEARPVELPFQYSEVLAAARLINDFEGARTHSERFERFGPAIGARLADLVARGRGITDSDYRSALDVVQSAREAIDRVFEHASVLLTPAAPGAAPAGLASTGDPAMNAVWTALGLPAITIPMPVPRGLPLGLQMISRRDSEAALIAAAVAVEKRFAAED